MISSQTIGSVAVLAGALVGGGVFLLIAFLVGVDVLPSTRAAEGGRLVRTASRPPRRPGSSSCCSPGGSS